MIELSKKNKKSLIVLSFTVAICISSFIYIPFDPVPLVLQNMLIILTAAVLGGPQGTGAVGLFFVLGFLGLPVFTGTPNNDSIFGLRFITQTFNGTFIMGYFIGAIVTAFFIGSNTSNKTVQKRKIAMGCFLGFVIIYLLPIMYLTNKTSVQSFTDNLKFYLAADAAKCLLTILIASILRPKLSKHLS